MATINENYLKLKAGYLFPEISRRVAAYSKKNSSARMISLGIGDVTQPLAPAVVEAMRRAVEELSDVRTFRGYGPEQGYGFLREAIAGNDYASRGIEIGADEVFISDGAKCDTANIQEIFSADNVLAVADPVYPVYIDTNVMAGRTGPAAADGRYVGVVYMSCTEENGFLPRPPAKRVDLVYLCSPNNPTGAAAGRDDLRRWVDYARQNKAVILFDAAYEAFITQPEIPHSIYEIEGSRDVAIEFRSFSKTAGFTGVRCGFCVVPRNLKAYTGDGAPVELNGLWSRRHTTKFNGASYISQAAAAAVYSPEGKRQTTGIIAKYMANAAFIRRSLEELGYTTHGGVNAPYIWMKTPAGQTSWGFFDRLLQKAQVITTPGCGFGPAGEGYIRLTAFGAAEDVREAMERFAGI